MTIVHSPIVDITTLNAVESLFRVGPVDPWGRQTAGDLVDFIIYAEKPRFVLPCIGDSPSTPLPSLLQSIQRAEPTLFEPAAYSTEHPRQLAPENLAPSFQRFTSWSKANKTTLRALTELHRQDWIRSGHLARVKNAYVFDADAPPVPRKESDDQKRVDRGRLRLLTP